MGSQRRLTILIADDNVDSAESLAILLSRDGDVHTASDGFEAVEMAAKIHPDVILLDIGMPRLDGMQAARNIRANENGKHAFIVALTGWGANEHLGDWQAAGIDLHLLKPVDFDALQRVLDRVAVPEAQAR